MKNNLHTKRNYSRLLCLALLCMLIHGLHAQSFIDSLTQDQKKIVAAIAPYPADVRRAILNIAQYPQALINIERTQIRTSQSFEDLISKYPQKEQEKFYEASRFPDAIDKLVNTGAHRNTEAEAVANEYPEGARTPMMDVYRNHFDDLTRIHSLYQSSDKTLEKILENYPPSVKDDFRKVISMPDVMTLLTDNIDLTIDLGDAYRADPQSTTQKLDSLNTALAVQNVKDLDEYKKEVENDPNLQEEMKSAANDFYSQYNQPDTSPTIITNNYYGTAPYPYWFGYPYWYASPVWYPAPFYFNTGFYIGLNGAMVVFGFPSYAYTNWFFIHGYSHYPLLYHHYNNYYNIHRNNLVNRNFYSGFNRATHDHFDGKRPSREPTAIQHNPENNVRQRETKPGAKETQPNINRENQGKPRVGSQGTTPRTNTGQTNRERENPQHFNNNSFNHYNANTFHRMNWQSVTKQNLPRQQNIQRQQSTPSRQQNTGGRQRR